MNIMNIIDSFKSLFGKGKIRIKMTLNDNSVRFAKVPYVGDINTLDKTKFIADIKNRCFVDYGFTPKKIEIVVLMKSGYYKFVLMESGEVRFENLTTGCRSHKEIANNEPATEAGCIEIADDYFTISDWRSMTLGISAGQVSIDAIAKELNLSYTDPDTLFIKFLDSLNND